MNSPFFPTASAAESVDATPTTEIASVTSAEAPASEAPASRRTAASSTTRVRRRRRRWPLIAGVTALALVGTGSAVYANIHKTVTLDVDGSVTKVSTFAGSVGDVLQQQGVKVGGRDEVSPAKGASLKDNGDIVVRTGHRVTVVADGKESQEWVTVLDADEALGKLDTRGSDVKLVASRSGAPGRATLPLPLNANGPVSLVADGKTIRVKDGSQGIEAILDQQRISLGELDRVSINRSADATPPVSLVVQRVKVEDVSTTTPVDFETVTEQDPKRYADLPVLVKQEGVPGVRTTVAKVTTVDGVEESREPVSDGVTTPPVSKILVQGTKVRAKATPSPKPSKTSTPKPTPTPTPSPSASADAQAAADDGAPAPEPVETPKAEAPAPNSAPAGVWAALAKCESGGNPGIVSSNGKYHGLYQFTVGTWRAVGGSGIPSQASAAEQTLRAQILQARSGWGQWPACARKLGLR